VDLFVRTDRDVFAAHYSSPTLRHEREIVLKTEVTERSTASPDSYVGWITIRREDVLGAD
jgi:hypothetical protein